MRYRLRYNVGPLFGWGPFGRRRRGPGLIAGLLDIVMYIVGFILQLIVWAVLLVVGVVYTIVWLLLWPFHRLFARPTVGSRL
jgi:hypothetical protein